MNDINNSLALLPKVKQYDSDLKPLSTDGLTSEQESDQVVSQINPRKIETELHNLFLSIPSMDVDELLMTLKITGRVTAQTFLIRGACTLRLLKTSAATRLAGGRSCKDKEGKGRQAQLQHLAREVGVGYKILQTDARIYDTFFSKGPDSNTQNARILSLSRELFVIALTAPDPHAALQVAFANSNDRTYGRQQFRQHVRELIVSAHGAMPSNSRSTNRATTESRWKLSPHAERALIELQQLCNQTPAEVISVALLNYHANLRQPPAPRQRSTTRTNLTLNSRTSVRADTTPMRKSISPHDPLPYAAHVNNQQPTLFADDLTSYIPTAEIPTSTDT